MPAAAEQPDVPLASKPMLALAESLLTLGLFCFAPWFTWHGVNVILGQIITPTSTLVLQAAFGLHSYSGWATAMGISIPLVPSPFFGYLWLIPLIALARIFVAGLHLRRVLSRRVMLTALLALSGLALLIEAGLLLQAQLFQKPLPIPTLIAPSNGSYIAAGVSWGFWCAVGIQATGIVAAVALLKPALPGRHTLNIARNAV